MPEEERERSPLSSADKGMVEAPRREPPEELVEDPIGPLPGEKPAPDTGQAEATLAPEVPDTAQKDESETTTTQ